MLGVCWCQSPSSWIISLDSPLQIIVLYPWEFVFILLWNENKEQRSWFGLYWLQHLFFLNKVKKSFSHNIRPVKRLRVLCRQIPQESNSKPPILNPIYLNKLFCSINSYTYGDIYLLSIKVTLFLQKKELVKSLNIFLDQFSKGETVRTPPLD